MREGRGPGSALHSWEAGALSRKLGRFPCIRTVAKVISWRFLVNCDMYMKKPSSPILIQFDWEFVAEWAVTVRLRLRFSEAQW